MVFLKVLAEKGQAFKLVAKAAPRHSKIKMYGGFIMTPGML